jgi:hypothetical protein
VTRVCIIVDTLIRATNKLQYCITHPDGKQKRYLLKRENDNIDSIRFDSIHSIRYIFYIQTKPQVLQYSTTNKQRNNKILKGFFFKFSQNTGDFMLTCTSPQKLCRTVQYSSPPPAKQHEFFAPSIYSTVLYCMSYSTNSFLSLPNFTFVLIHLNKTVFVLVSNQL